MQKMVDKSEGLKRMSELLLSGWSMRSEHCPICVTPLFTKGNEMKCPQCNLPVRHEKDVNASSASASTSLAALRTPMNDETFSEDDDTPTELSPSQKHNEIENIPIPSFEEMRSVYETNRRRQDTVSTKLGQRMLEGWTMLGTICPEEQCKGTPLMSLKGKPSDMECVSCLRLYKFDPDNNLVILNADAPVVATKNANEVGKSNDLLQPPQQLHSKATSTSSQSREQQSQVDASELIGQKLLQGWSLLAQTCGECNLPLMADHQKQLHCLQCQQGNGTNSLEKKANKTRLSPRDDVDADDDDLGDVNEESYFRKMIDDMKTQKLKSSDTYVPIRTSTPSKKLAVNSISNPTGTKSATLSALPVELNHARTILLQKIELLTIELEEQTCVESIGSHADALTKLAHAFRAINTATSLNNNN